MTYAAIAYEESIATDELSALKIPDVMKNKMHSTFLNFINSAAIEREIEDNSHNC